MHLDSLWVRQLICKSMFGSCKNFIANLLQWLFHRRNCPTEHYFTRLTCLRSPIRPIRKKLQNVEAPFCIIEVYSKHKLIAHTLEELKLKCKKRRSDNIVLGTVLLYILKWWRTELDLVTSADKKIYISGFSVHMIPDHSLFKNFLSGERIQKVTDSDTPDTRGRKPNPQRKNCGFKNIRIRVDGA